MSFVCWTSVYLYRHKGNIPWLCQIIRICKYTPRTANVRFGNSEISGHEYTRKYLCHRMNIVNKSLNYSYEFLCEWYCCDDAGEGGGNGSGNGGGGGDGSGGVQYCQLRSLINDSNTSVTLMGFYKSHRHPIK